MSVKLGRLCSAVWFDHNEKNKNSNCRNQIRNFSRAKFYLPFGIKSHEILANKENSDK